MKFRIRDNVFCCPDCESWSSSFRVCELREWTEDKCKEFCKFCTAYLPVYKNFELPD